MRYSSKHFGSQSAAGRSVALALATALAGLSALAQGTPAAAVTAAPAAPALLTPATMAAPPLTPARGIVQSRFTGVDPVLLRQLESKAVTRVRLDMFGQGEQTLTFNDREDYGSGRFALTGTLEGISPSQVVLAVWDGAVTVDAHAHAQHTVRLRNAGNGGFWLEEFDAVAQGGVCGNDDEKIATEPPAAKKHPLPAGPPRPQGGDGKTWLDLYACYTPQARAAAGGDAGIASTILARVATANAAHTAGDTGLRIRFIAISPVNNYNESGYIDTDRNRMQNGSDGFMDDIVAVADDIGADLVHLFVNEQGILSDKGGGPNPNVIGQANLSGRYGVTKWDANNLVFTHETGHNLGCFHQKASSPGGTIQHAWEATYDWYDPLLGVFLYTAKEETVMWATALDTVVGRFSDPNVSVVFSDAILGSVSIPLGEAGSANNAQFIRNQRLDTVLRKNPVFYMAPGTDGQACLNAPANNLSSVFDTWYANTRASSLSNAVVRIATGNYPAPARITTKSRLEKTSGPGFAHFGP